MKYKCNLVSATTFDTLNASKTLQNAGMEKQQADATATVIESHANLATKDDVSWLKWMMGIHFVITLGGFTLLATLIE